MITLWIGAAIGAGMSVAGGIAGGIAASKTANEATKKFEDQRRKNQDWYNRRYNEDATQRGDAQLMLTRTEELIRQRNKAAQGAQAVMGGTSESVAAAKAANNQAISNAAANITANAEARKDAIESTYMQNDSAFNQQQMAIENAKAQAVAEAVKGISSTGAAIAGSDFELPEGFGKKDKNTTNTTQTEASGG